MKHQALFSLKDKSKKKKFKCCQLQFLLVLLGLSPQCTYCKTAPDSRGY